MLPIEPCHGGPRPMEIAEAAEGLLACRGGRPAHRHQAAGLDLEVKLDLGVDLRFNRGIPTDQAE
jgi:hypothetical protein